MKGIVHTMSSFRMLDFNYKDYTYGCGWIATRPVKEGECWMWGNPIAEMMYETLRYFGERLRRGLSTILIAARRTLLRCNCLIPVGSRRTHLSIKEAVVIRCARSLQ